MISITLLVSHMFLPSYSEPIHLPDAKFARSLGMEDAPTQHEKPYDNTTTGLPTHHWQLSKSQKDIDIFRTEHNLILVDSSPTDAALHPSWPQALVQYFLIAPPINIIFKSGKTELTPWNVLQATLSPFLFIMWTVSFGLAQHQIETAGWLSVMGWVLWFDLYHMFLGPFALPMLLFQWVASFAVIVQRWTSRFGDIAYQINHLQGCIPVDGLGYLQQGARAHSFRVFQSVTFPIATLFMILYSQVEDGEGFTEFLVLPALVELIYTAVVASKGTPMVVSGNCLLVELSPRVGFLDSNISTRWKAFSSFMGF